MSKIIVVGLGKSGLSILDYYIDKSDTILAYDLGKNLDTTKFKNYENSKNISLILGKNPSGQEEADIVYLSPGISLYEKFVQEFQKRNIPITTEVELAYRLSKRAKFIAVTGTNGKTTTTSMLGDIYKNYNNNSYIVGNIGTAVLSYVKNAKENANFITELSSYQLESIVDFRPYIALILNISQDHLSRHKSMENYKKAKYNIAKNQTCEDFLVLNKDDLQIDIDLKSIKSKVVYFSMREKLENGVYYDEKKDSIISTLKKDVVEVIKAKDIPLLGEHNIQNTLACITVALLDDIPMDIIKNSIKNFKAVRHRLQKVAIIDDVFYINDSKGTNIDSSIKAINSIKENIILIAGGYDKMLEFDELVKVFQDKVKQVLVFGSTKYIIRDTAFKYGYKDVMVLKNLKQCVHIANIIAEKGDYVLLSPACASWDMYDNFEQRGDEFISLVENLK